VKKKRNKRSKLESCLLWYLFFPIMLTIYAVRKKSKLLNIVTILVWLIAFIISLGTFLGSKYNSTQNLVQLTQTKNQSSLKNNTAVPTENLRINETEILEFSVEATKTDSQTFSSLVKDSLATHQILTMQISPTFSGTQGAIAKNSKEVKELAQSSSGYSESELINSGREGTPNPDGTVKYESFYIAPNGRYYPLNNNAIKGKPLNIQPSLTFQSINQEKLFSATSLPLSTPKPATPLETKVIKELAQSSSGYSDSEMISSGREGIQKADGTLHFEGFYIAPNGNYFPINANALKGQSSAAKTPQFLSTLTPARTSPPMTGPASTLKPTISSKPAAFKDLIPSNSGYTVSELTASGRRGIKQSDGTVFFEGFFFHNGKYFAVNMNAVKGSTGDEGITGTSGSDCNPNYDVCLPNVGDLNCGDISYRRFRVIGFDVYGLDRDNDGIACESN
jgi:hypothetical protein